MKTTVLIPIIHFNSFSSKAISLLAKEPVHPNLIFSFIVSNDAVKDELLKIIDGIKNKYTITVANSFSSNQLRSYAVNLTTEYFYFHDCDDTADYDFIDKYSASLQTADTVLCFNVDRIQVVNGVEKRLTPVYNHYTEGPIKSLENLPVTVYSKFIPTKFAKLIDFPNLPFTQDWAISYSLFLVAPHIFNKKSTYTYYIYSDSSSRPKFDTIHRLNKITAYSKTIVKKYKQKGLILEADFLGFRYNTTLAPRYAALKVIIKPYIPYLKTFFKLSFHGKEAICYQTMMRLKEFTLYLFNKS